MQPLDSMVFQWFPRVANHSSNDGLVAIHRYGLNGAIWRLFHSKFSFQELMVSHSCSQNWSWLDSMKTSFGSSQNWFHVITAVHCAAPLFWSNIFFLQHQFLSSTFGKFPLISFPMFLSRKFWWFWYGDNDKKVAKNCWEGNEDGAYLHKCCTLQMMAT